MDYYRWSFIRHSPHYCLTSNKLFPYHLHESGHKTSTLITNLSLRNINFSIILLFVFHLIYFLFFFKAFNLVSLACSSSTQCVYDFKSNDVCGCVVRQQQLSVFRMFYHACKVEKVLFLITV